MRWIAVLVLVGVYAGPVLVPPAPTPPAPLPPYASLPERLFPDVPLWWVAFRAVALVAAAALVAASAVARDLFAGRPSGDLVRLPAPKASAPTPLVYAALVVAALHAATAFLAAELVPWQQSLYMAAFGAPALLLCFAASPPRPRVPDGSTLAALAIVALWFAWRAADAIGSARAADAVDMWAGFEHLMGAASGRLNYLTQGFLPGLSAMHLWLQGLELFKPGRLEGFATLQLVHLSLLAAAGLGVFVLSRRIAGAFAAPVALAAFLMGPLVLMMPLVPAALPLGPVFGVGLALLVWAVHERRSLPALAALGGFAGIAASHPSSLAAAGLAVVAAALSLLRRPRLPAFVLAIPFFSLFAALFPSLPDLDTLEAMSEVYTGGHGLWIAVEGMILGQSSPLASKALAEAANPGLLDVPLGALLSPFATPRTPLRLLGDVAYEPFAAGLLALGLAVSLRVGRTASIVWALLALLGVALAPGFTATFDRASLGRTFVAPVPLALLAGLGFEALRRGLLGERLPRTATALGVAVILVSGTALFDVVNPRILAASSLGLTARALGGSEQVAKVAILDHGLPYRSPFLYVDAIAAQAMPQPVSVLAYAGPDSLAPASGAPPPDLLFWSPGLEEDGHVASVICRHWRQTVLYELSDRAGLSRAFAARPSGPGWEPSPWVRWRSRPCGELGG